MKIEIDGDLAAKWASAWTVAMDRRDDQVGAAMVGAADELVAAIKTALRDQHGIGGSIIAGAPWGGIVVVHLSKEETATAAGEQGQEAAEKLRAQKTAEITARMRAEAAIREAGGRA